MKIVLDTHTHTLASGHAYSTIPEMARAAVDKGLELLAITEHGPMMPGSCQDYYFQNLRVLRREKYGICFLFGCELNILNTEGQVDLSDTTLEQVDLGIASMHIPCYKSGSVQENTQAYINAMKNPHVNIIGHPDDGRYPIDYEALVQAAKEHHVLIEINNSSLNPNGYRKNTWNNDLEILKYCKKYHQSVVLSSDAHVDDDVANVEYSLAVVKEAGLPEELVVNQSVDALLEYVPYTHF